MQGLFYIFFYYTNFRNSSKTVAKRVFKEEIIFRLESGSDTVCQYLRNQGYLDIFTTEEDLSLEPVNIDIHKIV